MSKEAGHTFLAKLGKTRHAPVVRSNRLVNTTRGIFTR